MVGIVRGNLLNKNENLKNSDDCDVQTHSVLVLGLSIGMCFVEISRLSLEHISMTSAAGMETLIEFIQSVLGKETMCLAAGCQ